MKTLAQLKADGVSVEKAVASIEAPNFGGTIPGFTKEDAGRVAETLAGYFGEKNVGIGETGESELIRCTRTLQVAGKDAFLVCSVWQTGRVNVNLPKSFVTKFAPELDAVLAGLLQ